MTDIAKHLERAQKYLEKNKIQNAIEEYLVVLEAAPTNQEVMQALGDLYFRQNDAVRAAQYYGMLFDRLAESRDTAKAIAIYTRFLKPVPQPPERVARFALLLQKQNKREEAIEYYDAAAELFLGQKNQADALACWDKIAQLDPENLARHVKVGEVGERLGKPDVAARGYLRAGQLALADRQVDRALELLERAHRLLSADRSVALCFAQALLQKGEARRAAELLDAFAGTEEDPPFLSVYGDALLQAGRLDESREIFEKLYRQQAAQCEKLFEVVDAYVKAGEEKKCAELVASLKERMFAAKQQNEFAAQFDRLAEANPQSVTLAEAGTQLYNELNRESKYFDYLVRLFDLQAAAGNFRGACDALDRLVDIDPYDSRHQERVAKLEGKADPNYLRGVGARMAKATSVSGQGPMVSRGAAESSGPPMSEEARQKQALEDLIVQTEIFLQYALHDKAIERLQKIAAMFPGEEEGNERLRNLYATANWWPAGAKRKAEPALAAAPVPTVAATPAEAAPSPSKSGIYSAETVRDLAKISEIGRLIYRQGTPKAVLASVVNEVGKYLRVTRCLAVLGAPGQPPQMAAEFCAPGVSPAEPARLVKLLAQLEQAPADSLGSISVDIAAAPVLKEMGLATVLGVHLVDKETQAVAGTMVLGHGAPRNWKPTECYFLQAVGDQALMGVNHTKLRSLVRNLAVADERTGLVGRGSYLDCLLAEWNRGRAQNTPLALVILQVDRGQELLRQHGEAQVERYVEELARTLQGSVRQSDLAVKYTAWSLAFILPDTKLKNAEALAGKLRKASASVHAPWDQAQVTLSAAVAEAAGRPDFDSEDVITDLINRAEAGLEEARKKGGDTVVSL
jgi:diguanylate cyclase (GGDEF)-like protein